MTIVENSFLQLLGDAIGTRHDSELSELGEEDWKAVFVLAKQHHVLPLIADEIYRRDLPVPPTIFRVFQKQAARIVSIQAVKTASFLSLYRQLSLQGLAPIVVKGLICRQLYPNPDFRFSADEDLLISPDEAENYYQALSALGLKTDQTEEEVRHSYEAAYTSEDRILFLEVHRTLFPEDSTAYGKFNELFTEAHKSACTLTVEELQIRTLAPTDHLLYLICHALKHFLHGGFGIRQVCDICLFAQKYGETIDWSRLKEALKKISGVRFTAALFSIGEQILKIRLPWAESEAPLPIAEVDFEPLLADILASGVYGASSLSRKHSSNITLSAFAKGNQKRSSGRTSWLRILFPKLDTMQRRYPYLKRRPFLLPAAWGQRLFGYFFSENKKGNSAKEAVRTGRERKVLLKEYGLLGSSANAADSMESARPGPQVRVVDTKAYISSLVELIQEGHEVSLPVTGSSMVPFLADGRDRVFLKEAEGKLKKGDVVLYRRKSGDYVLHRICRVHRRDTNRLFDMIGDAQSRIEPNIKREQILARAVRIERKGKIKTPATIYWLFFQYIWVNIIKMRSFILRVYSANH